MREILFEYLKQQKKIIVYGCGNYGRFLLWLLNKKGIDISYVCDSNEAIWYSKIRGIECIPTYKLAEHGDAIILISIYKYKEVLEKISCYKFMRILTWDDLSFLYEKLYLYADEYKEYMELVLNETPKLKVELKKNFRFKNIHAGKRCFIIGNGPSIREQNLAFLRDEITFTVNQLAKSPKFEEISTQYHVWADPNFFKNLELKSEGDYRLLEIMKTLPEYAECFFPYSSAHDYVEKFELGTFINVNYYEADVSVGNDEEIDFTRYIRGGYSVVQYAIRLAIYMGFKEIYLLGCECTGILNVLYAKMSDYSSVTHCYDIDEAEKERDREMYKDVPLEAYYRSEIGIFEEYKLINNYCNQNNIKIFNCTKGGLLDVFLRRNYDEVFSTNKRKE